MLSFVTSYVPLLVAALAALTALVGYLLNSAAGRRLERMRRYADALDAVERYQQLPYTYRRRHNETHEIPDELGNAYDALVDKIQLKNQTYRKEALSAPPAQADIDIEISPRYHFNQQGERAECLRLMRKHLHLLRNIF